MLIPFGSKENDVVRMRWWTGTALWGFVSLAVAQAYPSKPITLIVPFAPGGPSDAHMRQFALAMQRQLKQPLVIENVGGGSGNIGPARAAKAAADGYTLMQGNISQIGRASCRERG